MLFVIDYGNLYSTSSSHHYLDKLILPFQPLAGIFYIPQDIYNHLENDHNLLDALRVRLWAGGYYLHSIYPCLIFFM